MRRLEIWLEVAELGERLEEAVAMSTWGERERERERERVGRLKEATKKELSKPIKGPRGAPFNF